MCINSMLKDVESLFPQMVEIRRDLHQHPELSFQEVRTPKIIAEYLSEIGLEVRTKVGGRGVVGTLKGAKEGKTVAIRADFDALPIHDEKDVPYKSLIPGVMHACGHDGHTASLLAIANVLSKYKEDLEGNVVFIFQFAEEKHPGGARAMIADGCLDGVDIVFGAHLMSTKTSGEIYYREKGHILAAADMFEITIKGKGGHGALPQASVDPIVTGSQLVSNLQQIVSRRMDPIKSAVVTVGSFHAGSAPNVIPDTAKITGTVRTYDPEIREMIEKQIEQIANATCAVTGATCEVYYEKGYDSGANSLKETRYIRNIAVQVVGEENVKEYYPFMAGDDFAYYLKERPGSFFMVGAGLHDPTKVFPHHHPRFDFDENAMVVMAKVMVSAVVHLNKETKAAVKS